MSFADKTSSISSVLFTAGQIQERVRQMGEQITRDYEGKDLFLVCVLRGAAMFMTDLARCIDLPLEMDFMAVSSYDTSHSSSGVVRIVKDLNSPLEGRHILIAEDIIDSGLTLRYLIKNLASRGAASLEVATLLHKGKPGTVQCKYKGFDCPDNFVVGYGLDYANKYRNLPYIGILNPKEYE